MRTSPRFGQIITELKDELGSFGKLAIKTNISKAYLVEMAANKVPGPDYVGRVAEVYPSRAAELFEAADYTLPDRFRTPSSEFAGEIEQKISELPADKQDAARKMVLEELQDMAEKFASGEEDGGIDIEDWNPEEE